MTYFKKPDHSYHRVIFEFTDTEMKAVGFEKLSFNPSQLEILRVLNRLAEADENQREAKAHASEKPKPPEVQYITEGKDPQKRK